jgi:hypothetical protein
MLLRKNNEAYLPVRLLMPDCSPALGVTTADLLGGGVCVALMVGFLPSTPFPGFLGTIPLVQGDSWREVDPVCFPGLYIAELEAEFFQEWIPWGGRADLVYSVRPSGAAFRPAGFMAEATVEDLPQHISNYPLVRAVTHTFGQAFRLWRQMLAGRVKVDTAGNIRSVFHEDAVHSLAQVHTLDETASPSTDPIFETTEINQLNPTVVTVTP